MYEKGHFPSYRKRRHDAKKIVTICLLRHSGESLQNGQLELRRRNWYFARETHKDTAVSGVRQDFERVPEHRVSFEANPMRYSMGFAKSHSLNCSLHKWAWCGAARKSARLNCINLIHFRLTAGQLCRSSCIVIPGVDHTHTQFTEESKIATALTPQTDVTSGEAYRK